MLTRWNRWRRARPSLTRYVLMPCGSAIVASGLVVRVRVVEILQPSYF